MKHAYGCTSKTPTKEGHIFKGWASSRNAIEAQYPAGGSYTKNAKITLYAVWEPEVYTVTFDVNGGIGATSNETVTYGNTIKMPNSIIKEYAYLKGWSTDENATTPEYELGVDYKIKSNLTLYAVWGDATWVGEVSSAIEGSGTEQDPYLISTAADLAYVANKVNTQASAPTYEYYKLTDNINLTYTEWVPIGVYANENQCFYGSFDGNGYTISDLYITDTNQGYVGIFGYVKDSEIKNLTVTGAIESLTSDAIMNVGGIVGYASNSNFTGLSSKYFNIGSITTGTTDYASVGTIVGKTSGGNITECNSYDCNINIKAGKFYTGMIAGYCASNITDCTVESTEDGLFSTSATVGGFYMGSLCGVLTKTAEKCSVKAPYFSNNLKTTESSYIGGFVGKLDGTAKVCSVQFTDANEDSIASTGAGSVVMGGFTGQTSENSKIEDCKFDGKTLLGTTSGDTTIGGLVGNAIAKRGVFEKYVSDASNLDYSLMPKKNGYKATWYTDSNCTTLYDFSQTVLSDLTLYAKWEDGEDMPDIWDGTSSEPAYDTETKTYTITNGEELAWVSDVTNGIITSGTNFPADKTFSGYTIKLENNIYLNDLSNWENWEDNPPCNEWKPIGRTNAFKGVFDGQKHYICGIYRKVTNLQHMNGLFSRAINSTISNLIIDYARILTNSSSAATIVGLGSNIRIVDCHNASNVIVRGADAIGGICGNATSGYFLRCGNDKNSSITATYEGGQGSAGGIVGYAEDCRIEQCYNSGEILGGNKVGGIVGHGRSDEDDLVISRSFNAGEVKGSENATGGIAGFAYNVEIYICYNSAKVIGGQRVGGIVGEFRHIDDGTNTGNGGGSIEVCYNVGDIEADRYAGGLVGYFQGNTKFNDNVGGVCYIYNSYSNIEPLYYSNVTYIDKYYTEVIAVEDIKKLTLTDDLFSYNYKSNSDVNSGYPYQQQFEKIHSNHKITIVLDDTLAINRAFANVDGDLAGNADSNSNVGGIIGYGYGNANAFSVNKNIVGMVDNIYATSTGSATAYAGNVVGYNNGSKLTFENAYYNSEMNVTSSTNTIDATGIARSSKTMNVAFYTNLLGLTPYTSLDNVDEDASAVWVLKNGQLPELYYNCLNDITISGDIENGVVTVDKSQAVAGEIVTVTATPNENYVLNKVYVNGEEIEGTTFEMLGDCEVFATFAEEIPEYSVTVTATDNATGSLVNVDSTDMVLMDDGAVRTSIVANDGEEILVNTTADADYTVDAIYVNGEEIDGDSFILASDSVVTMDVESISTNITAVTNDAEDVSDYSAILSGSVSGDSEGISRYIRYWSADDTETVYTTEVETGSGEYTAELMDLTAETTYYYQMTEFGEIKSFTTCAEPNDEHIGEDDDGEDGETSSVPITTTTYKTLTSTYKFSIECSQALTTEFLAIACYDNKGKLLALKPVECDGDTSYTGSVPINTNMDYAKIFVWSSQSSLKPLAKAEFVDITN